MKFIPISLKKSDTGLLSLSKERNLNHSDKRVKFSLSCEWISKICPLKRKLGEKDKLEHSVFTLGYYFFLVLGEKLLSCRKLHKGAPYFDNPIGDYFHRNLCKKEWGRGEVIDLPVIYTCNHGSGIITSNL